MSVLSWSKAWHQTVKSIWSLFQKITMIAWLLVKPHKWSVMCSTRPMIHTSSYNAGSWTPTCTRMACSWCYPNAKRLIAMWKYLAQRTNSRPLNGVRKTKVLLCCVKAVANSVWIPKRSWQKHRPLHRAYHNSSFKQIYKPELIQQATNWPLTT